MYKILFVIKGLAHGALILLHPEHSLDDFNDRNEDNIILTLDDVVTLTPTDYAKMLREDKSLMEDDSDLDDVSESGISYLYKLVAPLDPSSSLIYVDIMS